MSDEQNRLPQASNLNKVNLAVDSDWVGAPVVDVTGPIDFGGDELPIYNPTTSNADNVAHKAPKTKAKKNERHTTWTRDAKRECRRRQILYPEKQWNKKKHITEVLPHRRAHCEREKDGRRGARQCKQALRTMRAATKKQPNISADVKRGIAELEESIDIIFNLRASRKSAQLVRRNQETQTGDRLERGSKKRKANSPMTSEMEKKTKGQMKERQEKGLDENTNDFVEVTTRKAYRRKKKEKRRGRHAEGAGTRGHVGRT